MAVPNGRLGPRRPAALAGSSIAGLKRHAWTNGFVERLQGTILSELWRVAFRRTYYTSMGQLERDLRVYLQFYNRERPHQGYRLQGRTPVSVCLARKAS